MHPLAGDLSAFKDAEIEAKIADLSRKYFAAFNMEVRGQITLLLDTYRDELARRRADEWQKMMETRNKDLDKLIRVE
jgi:hypothetical protein